MGVLYDYFRIADRSAAVQLMEASHGSSPVTKRVADGVDAKGIEPAVTLGRLVAFVLDVPWHVRLVQLEEIWPAGGGQDGEDDEDDDYGEGPWVVSLPDQVRDCLAGIDDGRLPQLAAWWSQIEELAASADPEFMLSVLTDLVGLARRAAAADDHLFCWICL